MENPADEIKKRIDIVEFIGSFITLKKAGHNFKAVCPFHQEKTPSFVVSPERQIWHCFGACQEGGDAIGFFMRWENIGFAEAAKELARRFGIKLQTSGLDDQTWKKKEKLLAINLLAAEYFNYMLEKTKYGEKALKYLADRQINKQIINKFQIGYSPNSWDSLYRFLTKKGYSATEIFDSGLLVKNDRGGYYDRFRGRLTFPLKDHRNNVVGFSGRILEGKSEAKYINTPETSIYHKRETLFGINLAKEAIKKLGSVFLVEGELDVISPYQNGVENIVAIKGSAVTKEQLIFLKRYTSRVVLALDSDAAGEDAMRRAIEETENMDFDLGVVTFDYAKDPDEAVRKDPEKFKKLIKKPLPVYDFIIDLAKKKYPSDTPFDKKNLANEVIFFLEKIQNPIVQSHYLKKLAELLTVSESSVYSLIRDVRKKKKLKTTPFVKSPIKKISIDREALVFKYLLSRIFQSEDPFKMVSHVFKVLDVDDFFLPSHQKIIETLTTYKKKAEFFNLKDFTQILTPPLASVFDELYLYASSDLIFEGENLTRLIYGAKKIALKKKLMSLFDQEGSTKNIQEITHQLNEVEKKLSSL